MKRETARRRRPVANISFGRASRLHRLVAQLGNGPCDRQVLLAGLSIGLRTFYRELDLLKRCGIKVTRTDHVYVLKTSPVDAQGRLPFPDPQLSFAEMSELAAYQGVASQRLAKLLESVVNPSPPAPKAAPRS